MIELTDTEIVEIGARRYMKKHKWPFSILGAFGCILLVVSLTLSGVLQILLMLVGGLCIFFMSLLLRESTKKGKVLLKLERKSND